MGFLDRLLGREPRNEAPSYPPPQAQRSAAQPPAPPYGGYPQSDARGGQGAATDEAGTADERAIARYRYLLRTAPPEALEQVHAEAFAKLTPDQRQQVLAELSRGLPPGEAAPSADPQSMARAATRAELRQPGYLEQTFSRARFGGMGGMGGGMGGFGMGMGGSIMGSMMGSIAGVVIGSAIADALFDDYGSSPEAQAAGDTDASGSDSSGSDSSGSDGSGSDSSGSDSSGSDSSGSDSSGSDSSGSDSSGDAGTGDSGGDASGAESTFADAGYQDGSSDAGWGDSGAGFGDSGFGDSGFGGGDFGGGDFGGGDFGGGDL